MDYFKDAIHLSNLAKTHTEDMENRYEYDIYKTIHSTSIFDDNIYSSIIFNRYKNILMFNYPIPKVSLAPSDTVSEIFSLPRKSNIFVLNFASYKYPGGKFLQGSSAQEESLCHNSNLYNVLSKFPNYYAENKTMLNKSLYTNRSIFTPNIVFERGNEIRYVNVLSCAAPNYTTAKKINVSYDENVYTLSDRIKFVLACMACMCIGGLNFIFQECPNILVLGAFGCGVFGQDSMEVANIFRYFIDKGLVNCFDEIIFAIPKDRNYYNFNIVFS